MQVIERFFGIKADDFKSLAPNLKDAFASMLTKYDEETAPKLKLVDNMIVLCLAVFLVQVTYGIACIRDPFNSFIAGTFTSLGMFALTMGLRIQLAT